MRYIFEQIEINTALRTVQVHGIEKKVQPKVFDLLVFLIENRDKAISKQELQNRLWPNMEVTETALTRAVMKARKLININSENIKTVHGHGYHFVAEVQTFEPIKQSTSDIKSKFFNKYSTISALILLTFIFLAITYRSSDKLAKDTMVLVLPVIDQTNDPNLSWSSLGLMSLATQMLKSRDDISVVSHHSSAGFDVSDYPEDLQISDKKLTEITGQTRASHVVLSSLASSNEGIYTLKQVIYHPHGTTPSMSISGKDPTALMQRITQQFMTSLPNHPGSNSYRTVSDDVFTNELYARGMAHQIRGDAIKAKEYFSLVTLEDSSLFWPLYELALTTRKLGDTQTSISQLNELLAQLDTFDVEPRAELAIYNALGYAYQVEDDDDTALKYYQMASDLATDLQDHQASKLISSNISLTYRRLGDRNQARTWLYRSKQIAVDHDIELTGQINYQLAQLERDEGQIDKALPLFQEALVQFQHQDMQRHVAAAYSSLGDIYSRMGKWTRAEEQLQLALKKKNHSTTSVECWTQPFI